MAHPQTLGAANGKGGCCTITKFERLLRVRAGLNDKLHLLHIATPSRKRVEAVLSNAWKPTERVRENEEAQGYVLNEKAR